jgi:uncharacterized protein YecT (DUF1311 family)
VKTRSRFLSVSVALLIAAAAAAPAHGQEHERERPGTYEAAAVDRANAAIEKVYDQLLSKLEPEQQKSLKEAQRAWIKWRDAEADLIARLGGAIAGSAFRVDYANAQAKLIQERPEV